MPGRLPTLADLKLFNDASTTVLTFERVPSNTASNNHVIWSWPSAALMQHMSLWMLLRELLKLNPEKASDVLRNNLKKLAIEVDVQLSKEVADRFGC